MKLWRSKDLLNGLKTAQVADKVTSRLKFVLFLFLIHFGVIRVERAHERKNL